MKKAQNKKQTKTKHAYEKTEIKQNKTRFLKKT